ncbi:universal stress protein [Natronomonas sp.]|uniref:universal stress protein n=1 Tax=Natronomonas sp. TaxID=2184060 RepID=UPI002FC3900C
MEYERVLVATDGSEHATDAAAHACDLANRHDATLDAVYVMDTENADMDVVDAETLSSELRTRGEAALQAVVETAGPFDIDVETMLLEGVPFEEVLTYTEENGVDVIVVGRRGRSEYKRVLLGSTTDAILRHSPVPVFVCP